MDMPAEYIHAGDFSRGPGSLTVTEAIGWLACGEQVQLICEASPWPTLPGSEAMTRQFKERAFASMSATLPARVAVALVANLSSARSNQSDEMSCKGIDGQSPGGEREVPDFDSRVAQISEAFDGNDVAILSRLCIALNLRHAALVNEGILVYSPSSEDLLSAMAFAILTLSQDLPSAQWQFVSDRPNTLANIADHGGAAVHPGQVDGLTFRRDSLSCDPMPGIDPAQVHSRDLAGRSPSQELAGTAVAAADSRSRAP